MDLSAATKSIEALLIQAGELIASDFGEKSFSINTKEDGSPVTTTDIKVQEYLIKGLKKILPQCTIISEEFGLTNYPNDKKYIITLDPLAGTTNFLNGISNFDIMVSIITDGKVTWGTTYNPISKEFNGIRETRLQNTSKTLRTISRKSFPYKYKANILEISKKQLMLGYRPIINLINGELDFVIYPNDAIDIWDLAPLHGVLKAQGGNLYTLSGEEYQYSELINKEDLIALMDRNLLRKVIESIEVTQR